MFTLPHGATVHDLILASVFGFTAFAGFEGAASLGEETRDPRRSIPKALIIAVIGGIVLYVATVAIMAMGFGTSAAGGTAFANSTGPLFQLASTYTSKALAEALEIGAMFSAFNAALGTTIGGGRLIFAMTRDARPSSRLSVVGREGEPTLAVVVVVVFALVTNVGLRAAGVSGLHAGFYLGTLGTLSLLVAYGMVNVGAGRLMRRRIRAILPLLVPLLGIAVIAYTLFNEVHPLPPAPYASFPFIVAAWLLAGIVFVLAVPGMAQRIGRGLAAQEGLRAVSGIPKEHSSHD